MRKRSLHNISICLFVFFITMQVQAQTNSEYKAALDSITATRFYKIKLTPQVVGKCKEGLEDIRIADEDGKQISYIVKNDLPAFKTENLIEFPIVKYAKEKDKQTHIILQNTSGHPLSNLLLFIKNMDAYRTFSISGSDDSIHWFIIKENMHLEGAFSNNGENIINTLSFPRSNYQYFQLTIGGENVLPFNITKAGIYNEDIVFGKYIEIPSPTIIQRDSSNKESYVHLQFNDTYYINKIILDAKGSKYFKRKIIIKTHSNSLNNILSEDYISSDSVNSFILNAKAGQLIIIINNEDNNPLKIEGVQAFQLNISLLAYLQSGKKYYLSFGDSLLEAPKYDLRYFSDSAEKNPEEIGLKKIEENKIIVPPSHSYWFKNKAMLWLIIITVLGILSFFTFKMMKEVNSKSSDD